jgi:hypothetical protein
MGRILNLVIIFFFVLFVGEASAQCGTSTNQGTITPSPTSQNTPTINSGRPYWEFSATAGCTYTFSTCSSFGDTYLRLYNTSWAVQAENDDACSLQSTITWTCVTNGTYRIHLSRVSYSPMNYCDALNQNTFITYSRSCPTDPPLNDNCSGATILALDECNWTEFVLRKEATNSGVAAPACLQPSGIGCGIGSVVEDIWYRFTGNGSQTTIEAQNDNHHMAMQIYRGSCGALIPVTNGCSDVCPSPSPVTESVTISTVNGTVYYIRLMRTYGDGVSNDMNGRVKVFPATSHPNQGTFGTVAATNAHSGSPTLTLSGAPNTCADVGTLRTGVIQVRNLGSRSRDNSFASQSCFQVEQTVSTNRNMWARVTIPAGSSITGLYFYSTVEGVCPQPTSDANIRTGYINVYNASGGACTPVDPCGGKWDNFITSTGSSAPFIRTLGTERINVAAGQTYWIEVWTTTFGNDPNFNFDVHVVPLGAPPANELCSGATNFSGSGFGCNLGANPACTGGYTFPCMFTVENSVFYTYTSPGTPFQIQVENVVCEGGAQDLQLGIFEVTSGDCSSNLNGTNLVTSGCFTGTTTFNINSPLPAGSTYLLWMDGNAGAACSWGFTILPVEFNQFNVSCVNNEVRLNWSTYSELNNYYFTIERSSDGYVFEEIAQVTGSGTTNQSSTYQWVDDRPFPGLSYYRLSQTDYDGTRTVLKTLSFVNDCANLEAELEVYPNPTVNESTIRLVLPEDTELELQLVDAGGRLIREILAAQPTPAGVLEIVLPTHELASGVYIIRASLNKEIKMLKLLK